jgi:hypothetical protein
LVHTSCEHGFASGVQAVPFTLAGFEQVLPRQTGFDVWHSLATPQLDVKQQTPFVQKPLTQSRPETQEAPFGLS